MRLRWISMGVLAAVACAGGAEGAASAADSVSAVTAGRSGAPAATAPGTVLFVGTSLTAGYGLPDPAHEAIPARIAERIDTAGLPFRVVNAGVSGETSAGALQRIGWVLRREPADVIVLETGANDALRGLKIESVRANIQAILDSIRAIRPTARVVLVQMLAPPNLGPRYVREFRDMYPALARENEVALTPFLLEGVAGVTALNQEDAIHPTAEGAGRAAATIWPTIRAQLDSSLTGSPVSGSLPAGSPH